jgi:hypothetical protein
MSLLLGVVNQLLKTAVDTIVSVKSHCAINLAVRALGLTNSRAGFEQRAVAFFKTGYVPDFRSTSHGGMTIGPMKKLSTANPS